MKVAQPSVWSQCSNFNFEKKTRVACGLYDILVKPVCHTSQLSKTLHCQGILVKLFPPLSTSLSSQQLKDTPKQQHWILKTQKKQSENDWTKGKTHYQDVRKKSVVQTPYVGAAKALQFFLHCQRRWSVEFEYHIDPLQFWQRQTLGRGHVEYLWDNAGLKGGRSKWILLGQ